MIKIIAFHLPQFHAIPENDQWWGEGFTEWTNTQKCKPIFPGHYQPREPMDNHYYNLLDKTALKWQADLAKKYGIYGFCFYHYWFEGKLLLERPLQIYLENKDIDFPFCFSWANHSWSRIWEEKKDILLEQTYGNMETWKKHFHFLLPYFRDDRYIQMQNKPVLIFNRPLDFEQAEEMTAYWQELAKENGLRGIYFIETLSGVQKESVLKDSSALLESQPGYLNYVLPLWYRIVRRLLQMVFFRHKPSLNLYDYLWKTVLDHKPIETDKMVFPGSFINWDNTARRRKKGVILCGFSIEKFERYLTLQLTRTREVYHSEYLFINAWNEWAEGNYLEPDKKYGHGYLEAVSSALEKTA